MGNNRKGFARKNIQSIKQLWKNLIIRLLDIAIICVLCEKRMFDEYCEWLFNILFEVENRTDISNYDSYNKRLYGFLSERLINIWVMQTKFKSKRISSADDGHFNSKPRCKK